MSDPTIVDEVWAEEGSIAVRVRNTPPSRKVIEIIQHQGGGSGKVKVLASATLNVGRQGRLAKAIDATHHNPELIRTARKLHGPLGNLLREVGQLVGKEGE